MNILITGCNGRIGKQLAKTLKKNNYVRGIDINYDKNHILDKFIKTDLKNIEKLNEALIDIDIVIHLASLMSWHPDDNENLFSSNVQCTFNLISIIANHQIK